MRNFMHTAKRPYILALVLLCVVLMAACSKECQHQWNEASCDAAKTCQL